MSYPFVRSEKTTTWWWVAGITAFAAALLLTAVPEAYAIFGNGSSEVSDMDLAVASLKTKGVHALGGILALITMVWLMRGTRLRDYCDAVHDEIEALAEPARTGKITDAQATYALACAIKGSAVMGTLIIGGVLLIIEL